MTVQRIQTGCTKEAGERQWRVCPKSESSGRHGLGKVTADIGGKKSLAIKPRSFAARYRTKRVSVNLWSIPSVCSSLKHGHLLRPTESRCHPLLRASYICIFWYVRTHSLAPRSFGAHIPPSTYSDSFRLCIRPIDYSPLPPSGPLSSSNMTRSFPPCLSVFAIKPPRNCADMNHRIRVFFPFQYEGVWAAFLDYAKCGCVYVYCVEFPQILVYVCNFTIKFVGKLS